MVVGIYLNFPNLQTKNKKQLFNLNILLYRPGKERVFIGATSMRIFVQISMFIFTTTTRLSYTYLSIFGLDIRKYMYSSV